MGPAVVDLEVRLRRENRVEHIKWRKFDFAIPTIFVFDRPLRAA